jgi:anti-sigma B factor antagonist
MQPASISADPNGAVSIVLRGDVDFTTSPAVLQIIRAGLPDSAVSSVRVDLADVGFMDSSGMGVMVQILRLAEEAGAGLRVEHPNRNVHDQLQLSGLAELLGLPATEPRWTSAPSTEIG